MDKNTILGQKNWTVEQFNSGVHLRINGVIDVWPRTGKWMPVRAKRNAEWVGDMKSLRKIVAEAEAERDAVKKAAVIVPELVEKPAVEPMTREELVKLVSTGIAFAHQRHLTEPEYTADRALAEIERILGGTNDKP